MKYTEPSFYIRKEPKEKLAFRLESEADIPECLKDAISTEPDGTFRLDCLEGVEIAPKGVIVAYEQDSRTKSGWNAWVCGKDRLACLHGKFYTRPSVTEAALIRDGQLPDFMQGANVYRNEDGSYFLTTPWGTSIGRPGEGLFVCYKRGETKEDRPDVNILTFGAESVREYRICTKDGESLGPLTPETAKEAQTAAEREAAEKETPVATKEDR